jgi:sirohydrochlorin cobaltochelatase
MSGTRFAFPKAPVTEPNTAPRNGRALLLFAHGTSDGAGAEIADRLASELSRKGLFDEVAVCFSLQEPRPADALARLSSSQVFVMPLLACDGRITRDVLPGLIGLADERDRNRVTLCPPIGQHPGIARLVAGMASAAADEAGFVPSSTTVLIAGHGHRHDPTSAGAARRLAGQIRANGRWVAVDTVFLSEMPTARHWPTVSETRDTIVVPYFISGGRHEAVDLPAMIRTGESDVSDGRRVVLTSAVGRAPQLAYLVIDQVLELVRDHVLETA